jgi:hypothetical protein
VTDVPHLHAIPEGRWQAKCQFCKVESIPVAGVDAAHAWADLEKLGWTVYVPVPGAMVSALCKACSEKNARIMEAVAKAKKGRKRK